MKNILKKAGKYLRELSVVVVGIAITFAGNNWINRKSEQNDLQMYLNAVKLELEDNITLLKSKSDYHAHTDIYRKYLLSDKPEYLSSDSLQTFKDVTQGVSYFVYKSSAFEMFKTSGFMRLIKDKQLLQAIWDCYDTMEAVKIDNNHYMEVKSDEIRLAMFSNLIQSIDIRKPESKRMYLFYTTVGYGMGDDFNSCITQIQQTLQQF